MKRNSTHRSSLLQSTRLSSKCYFKYLRCNYRILKKHLIKIPEPEEEQAVAMLLLEPEILAHHRREVRGHKRPLCGSVAAVAARAVPAAAGFFLIFNFRADAKADGAVHALHQRLKNGLRFEHFDECVVLD